MMKNKKMGILAVLVMLVAVTLNAVGGTYAKYISSYGTTDEARVAKWDFKVDEEITSTVDLFQASYTNENGTYVASKDAAKVIAPGTSGEYKYAVSGSAEVNVKVTESMKIENGVQLYGTDPVTGTSVLQYDPLRFSVDGTTWMTSEEFNNQYGKSSSEVYPANYEFKGENALTGTIYWMWPFENDATDANSAHIRDELDTRLGELVVKQPEEFVVSATIGTTVEQTKEAPTVGTAYKLATVTNRIPAEAAANFATNWGYEADKAKDVVFNGYQLTGTIRPTSNPTANKMFPSAEQTGYFYTISIKGEAGQKITWGGENGTASEATFDGTGVQNLMLTLNPTKGQRQAFYYHVYAQDGTKIGDYSIDYSNLVFAE